MKKKRLLAVSAGLLIVSAVFCSGTYAAGGGGIEEDGGSGQDTYAEFWDQSDVPVIRVNGDGVSLGVASSDGKLKYSEEQGLSGMTDIQRMEPQGHSNIIENAQNGYNSGGGFNWGSGN